MKTSEYLEQTLSFEQSPATEQYFEFRASHIFELQEGSSSIEIHVQRPQSDQSIDSLNLVQKGGRKHEFDSDSEPPSPVDWHRYSRENPPHYVGRPGLERQRISNAEDLETIASVRKFMVVMVCRLMCSSMKAVEEMLSYVVCTLGLYKILSRLLIAHL